MAVLPDEDRVEIWGNSMRLNLGLSGLNKADLRDAVNALDDFLNSNASAINSAIPQPDRSALTVKQKARLLVLVVERRFIKET